MKPRTTIKQLLTFKSLFTSKRRQCRKWMLKDSRPKLKPRKIWKQLCQSILLPISKHRLRMQSRRLKSLWNLALFDRLNIVQDATVPNEDIWGDFSKPRRVPDKWNYAMLPVRWKRFKKSGKATAKWTSYGLLELNRQGISHILI